MASGIQAQESITADTETTVYTVPAGYVGVYKIIVRNTSETTKSIIKIWYTSTTTSDDTKVWEEQFEKSFSVSGEVLEAGKKIIIETSENTVVTVMGIEEAV